MTWLKPAGGALAVDREGFAGAVSTAIEHHPRIEIRREEVSSPGDDWGSTIVATGPLTSAGLADFIAHKSGTGALAFFDAIAPIVHRDSIDMSVAWFQSRYDKSGPGGSGADYINCPLDRDQYHAFVSGLRTAETVEFKEWEDTPYFDGCLPIEVMAERGIETLRFASGDEGVRAALYDQLGDDLFEKPDAMREAIAQLLDDWGEKDTSEDDENDADGAKRSIPEKVRKKLLDTDTWTRDAKLVATATRLREILGDGLFEDHNTFSNRPSAR